MKRFLVQKNITLYALIEAPDGNAAQSMAESESFTGWQGGPEVSYEVESDGDTSEVFTVLSPAEAREQGAAYCPRCYTFGHTHRADCAFRNDGMARHVRNI